MRLARWLTAVAILALGGASGAEPPILRVGTSGDYAPFSVATVVDPDEPPERSGFDVAVASAYARDRGLELEFVAMGAPPELGEQ